MTPIQTVLNLMMRLYGTCAARLHDGNREFKVATTTQATKTFAER